MIRASVPTTGAGRRVMLDALMGAYALTRADVAIIVHRHQRVVQGYRDGSYPVPGEVLDWLLMFLRMHLEPLRKLIEEDLADPNQGWFAVPTSLAELAYTADRARVSLPPAMILAEYGRAFPAAEAAGKEVMPLAKAIALATDQDVMQARADLDRYLAEALEFEEVRVEWPAYRGKRRR